MGSLMSLCPLPCMHESISAPSPDGADHMEAVKCILESTVLLGLCSPCAHMGAFGASCRAEMWADDHGREMGEPGWVGDAVCTY